MKTDQFRRVDYVKIEPARWRMLLNEETWPAELRWVRQQFIDNWRTLTTHDQQGIGSAPAHIDRALSTSPRFFIVSDGKLVMAVPGLSGWKTFAAPLLTTLVGA